MDCAEALPGLGLAAGAERTRASMDAVGAWFGTEESDDVAGAVVELCDLSLSQPNHRTLT